MRQSPHTNGTTPLPQDRAGFAKKLLLAILAALVLGGVAFAQVQWRLWPWTTQPPSDLLMLYGNVDIRDVEVAFNESDRITTMLVKEGDHVTKGQLLAVLDERRLKAALARAEAQTAAQKQVLERLLNGTRPEDIRKARADVDLAKAEVENARRTKARREALVTKKAASKQEVDDAQGAFDEAEARQAASQAALDLAVAGPRKEDIAEARATLEAFTAQLELAKVELADASLHAPANGVIQERLLEPGDMASPQKPVFTLALTDPVWVRAYVAEPDVGKLKLGMAALVQTDSFPGKNYEAWVGFISPTAEFTPKSVEVLELRTRLVYQARVFVKNPADELRLGMPATVRIDPREPGASIRESPAKGSAAR